MTSGCVAPGQRKGTGPFPIMLISPAEMTKHLLCAGLQSKRALSSLLHPHPHRLAHLLFPFYR